MFRLTRFVAVLALSVGTTRAATLDIPTVPVGNPGNVGELSGAGAGGAGPDRICGSVDYAYNIGKYEVTAGQYTVFLNVVAATDAHNLYDTEMWSNVAGCKIQRSGSSGNYTYSVASDRANRPVNYVSWYDALRFANWLHNGQPTGPQGSSTTEDGAYDMSLGSSVVRKPGALVFLPSEDEWYKAAYYKGGGTNAGYWDYPTLSDTVPTAELPAGTDLVNGSANYNDGAYLDTTYYTTEVGAYIAKPSESAYGTFDQGGNLWEWNEALVGGEYRGLRGGSWHGGGNTLRASLRLIGHLTGPRGGTHSLGFRIASIPEPGSMTLLVCGALGLLAHGWRRRRR